MPSWLQILLATSSIASVACALLVFAPFVMLIGQCERGERRNACMEEAAACTIGAAVWGFGIGIVPGLAILFLRWAFRL